MKEFAAHADVVGNVAVDATRLKNSASPGKKHPVAATGLYGFQGGVTDGGRR